MQWVHADAPAALIGQVADVLITDAHPNSLAGQIGAAAGSAMVAGHVPDPDIFEGSRL
jgi:hypothetical protein